MRYKTKSIFKKIALVLAGITALTATCFGVKAIVDYAKNDLKTITPVFEVGNLGTDGKYVSDESTLYTKEAFGCYGLQIKPDFDSTVDFQIYYYDILDNFVSSSDVLSNGYSDDAPINGAYARMVIIPREDEDDKISLVERITYPSQLTIKVFKEQDIDNRFAVFDGKVMQIVAQTKDLVFTPGLWINDSSFIWEENLKYCATSTTILKVKGGSSLSFKKSYLPDSFSSSAVKLYQFKDLPLQQNYFYPGFMTTFDTSMTLDTDTKYIIICVTSGSNELSWNSDVLQYLFKCFSFDE